MSMGNTGYKREGTFGSQPLEEHIARVKGELDDTINDLDIKLNRVLAKQEYDYLKGYNIYVKRKEKELRALIQEMHDKTLNTNYKDERIRELEQQVYR
mmetsp:Transcript_4866/g.3465  ORF Transcript_4866/g.3465 Transcript_4866/m.3465 type:complete len:98 (+) Transcript_4866:219-512(+)